MAWFLINTMFIKCGVQKCYNGLKRKTVARIIGRSGNRNLRLKFFKSIFPTSQKCDVSSPVFPGEYSGNNYCTLMILKTGKDWKLSKWLKGVILLRDFWKLLVKPELKSEFYNLWRDFLDACAFRIIKINLMRSLTCQESF